MVYSKEIYIETKKFNYLPFISGYLEWIGDCYDF